MSDTPNPIRPIAQDAMTLGHQVRRLRNHVAGYDTPTMTALGQMLVGCESSIDLAALRTLQTSAAFDAAADQMTPDQEPATVFAARKIEAFAGHCRDQRQLVEAFRGPAGDHVATQDDPLHDELSELSDLLGRLERVCNRTAARLAGV